MPSPPPNSGLPCAEALVVDDHDAVGGAHLVRVPALGHRDVRELLRLLRVRDVDRASCRSGSACGRRASVLPSTHTCPPPATSIWATSFVFLRFQTSFSTSPAGVRAEFSRAGRTRLQRRLVAADEEDDRALRSLTCSYHSFAGTARVSKLLPVEALAADERMAEPAALERRDEQARGLLDRPRALAGAQHLREEGHGLEHRPAA